MDGLMIAGLAMGHGNMLRGVPRASNVNYAWPTASSNSDSLPHAN